MAESMARAEMQLYTIPAKVTFKGWAAQDGPLTARFRLRNGGATAVGPVALRAPSRSKRFELSGAESVGVIEAGNQVVYTVTFVPPASASKSGNYQDAAVFSIGGEAVLCVVLQAVRDGDSAPDASFAPKASEVIPPSLLAAKVEAGKPGKSAAAAASAAAATPPAAETSAPSSTEPARPRSARASRGVTEAQRLGGRVPAVILHPRLRDMFFIEGQWLDAKGQEWSEVELKSLEADEGGAATTAGGASPPPATVHSKKDVVDQQLRIIEAAEATSLPSPNGTQRAPAMPAKEGDASARPAESPAGAALDNGRRIVVTNGTHGDEPEEYFLPPTDDIRRVQREEQSPTWLRSSDLVAPVNSSAAAGDGSYEEDDDDDYLRHIESEMSQRSAATRLSSGAGSAARSNAKKAFRMPAPTRRRGGGGGGGGGGYEEDEADDDEHYLQQLATESRGGGGGRGGRGGRGGGAG
eukprot:SAG22_NODE_296_length_12811_cov_14.899780_11_plen_468_part_00